MAEGDPAESLIAASEQADLLVVGTRGRSPFAGLMLGAVSQRCAAAAPCPVVLVKLPGEKATDTVGRHPARRAADPGMDCDDVLRGRHFAR